MATYFFHIVNGTHVEKDVIGTVCPDDENACRDALSGAREIMADAVRFGKPMGIQRCFRVEREDGEVVVELRFADAVELG